jgi:predicted phage terminase large subunit-like protein
MLPDQMFELPKLPRAFAVCFANPALTRRRASRKRCMAHLIDFVEAFWPIIEPEQPFVRGWVQEEICRHLEAVSAGSITKLLINVPPGFTKSMLVNVFWPAWEWGPRNRPDLRYISWSYAPRLTVRDNENCRKIMESPLYREWWGDRFDFDPTTNAKDFYKNTRGGFRIATSIGGTGTGLRADRLIWDDPHSVADADSPAALETATRWFSRTLPTRVRNASNEIGNVRVPYWVRDVHGIPDTDDEEFKKLAGDDGKRKATISATVGIMQRIHLHDISGIILENPDLGYEHLLIEMEWKGKDHPARQHKNWKGSSLGYRDPRETYEALLETIAALDAGHEDEWSLFCRAWRFIAADLARLADPVRYPRPEIEKLKAQLSLDGGNDAIAAQLDQWPLQAGGNFFAHAKDKLIELHDVDAPIVTDERGFDFASGSSKKSAQTAAVKIRTGQDRRIYIMHSAAVRGGPKAVDDFIKGLHTMDDRVVEWSIPEDPGSGGKHVASYVKRTLAPGRYVTSSPERGSKIERAKPISAQFNGDNVRIVRHEGCEQLIKELTDFPYGEFCDLVDALSRAYDAQILKAITSAPDGGEIIGAGEVIGS